VDTRSVYYSFVFVIAEHLGRFASREVKSFPYVSILCIDTLWIAMKIIIEEFSCLSRYNEESRWPFIQVRTLHLSDEVISPSTADSFCRLLQISNYLIYILIFLAIQLMLSSH
jgi:hypothetical protein